MFWYNKTKKYLLNDRKKSFFKNNFQIFIKRLCRPNVKILKAVKNFKQVRRFNLGN